ncbi:MAG: aminotransferase class I/II-fold pyridoxal phosphate-dependent enzyme [Deltaproteobacteria bacterium]|jgi:aspartate/methionine/tyrosine aminotransferase|nr:aminotransferase class I/II-fold pyridoxal phosphate-dependent enzyme [Deltaproteobacteria bacterium]
MRIADRIQRLGTETAFAVAARAAAHAAGGATVHPFHLGDLNFATPAHIVEAARRAIRDGKTGYCPNGGILPLREALADDVNARRGTAYTADHVSVQPGGKPVIGKFLQVLMNPGDAVLCPSPGYPIYESLVGYFGGTVAAYGFVPGAEGFRIDFEGLERAITPKTRLLIVNDFQNPTGAACSDEERAKLADIAQRHDLMVLLDEAYFEIHYEGRARSIVSQPGMAERCVLLYTFGKKFAMTGWRLGAAIGPGEIIAYITKLNVNDESCTNHFVQYAGLAGLTGDQTEPAKIVQALRERRDAAAAILNATPGVRCYSPPASFYLYPDVTDLMERKGFGDDYGGFAEDVLVKTGVSFCTRLHFGAPLAGENRRYIRLAYSGIDVAAIKIALGKFQAYAA